MTNTRKTAIVTGASQGIGAGLVKAFLDRGYNVVANSRNITKSGAFETREYLGSLEKVTRIVRLGVSVATLGDVRDQPKVADGASELLQDVFGKDKNPSRLVYGVASLPLGTPVELEIIFEVAGNG